MKFSYQTKFGESTVQDIIVGTELKLIYKGFNFREVNGELIPQIKNIKRVQKDKIQT